MGAGKFFKWASFVLLSALIAACGSEESSSSRQDADPGAERQAPAKLKPESPTSAARRGSAPPPAGVVPDAADSDAPGGRHTSSENAHDLLDELTSLQWDDGVDMNQQAAYLLQRLRLQGAGALIAIRDFLLDGDLQDGGEAASALRQALLNVLLGLGLPEVADVALELLQNGASPAEVWQLGGYLERVQPGQHVDSIRAAAERSLAEAQPSTGLPAEFFLLLGAVGNEQTARLLASSPASQDAYGSLALAAIPDGSGLPALEQDARLFEAGRDTLQGRLAMQLLAQQAPQFPQAAAALIDLAERGAIPLDLWPYVLDIVAGNWVLTMEKPSSGLVGSHTFYRPGGDQVIYRVAPPPGFDDGLQSERLYLLDRLQPLAPPDLGP